MQSNIHKDFILSPISNILKDAVSASSGIGSGIETFPLCDYVMQSTFLKMTGSQEQKMKCIIWELATIDFDYRRTLLSNEDKLGECSSYKDKNAIYKRLLDLIKKYNPKFDIEKDINAVEIRDKSIQIVKREFSGTNLSIWAQTSFNEFTGNTNFIKPEHFLKKEAKSLFVNVLQDKYEVLYKHRNRIAHNTQSYQQNLPTLKTLVSPNHKYENYFIYFSILVLIDNIFIAMYKKHLKAIEDNL